MALAIHFSIPAALLVALTLGACSEGGAEARPAFGIIAKVNEQEIRAAELSSVLAPAAAQAVDEAAYDLALERLIDQELMVQQARERSLDRDPRVLSSIEAAQREILARAYLEQVTSATAPPSDAEIAAFYAAHPELFAERRIYSLQELQIQLPAARFDELQGRVARAVGVGEVTAWLAQEGIPFQIANAVKPAEQLPLDSLKGLAGMQDGQMALSPTEAGALLVHLVASRRQPVDEAGARPMIGRYLTNARKVALAKAEMERLRDGARIEYAGEPAAVPGPIARARTETAAATASDGLPGVAATDSHPAPAPVSP